MIVIIGLLIAFVLILIFSNRDIRQCKWRADRRLDKDSLSFFRCAVCGAECFTNDRRPPRLCQAKISPPSL